MLSDECDPDDSVYDSLDDFLANGPGSEFSNLPGADYTPGDGGGLKFSKTPDGLRECLRGFGLLLRRNGRTQQDEVLPINDCGRGIVESWHATVIPQPDGWVELDEPHINDLRLTHIPQHCTYIGENGRFYRVNFEAERWFQSVSALSASESVDPFKMFLEGHESHSVKVPEWDGKDRWALLFTEGYGVSETRHSKPYLAHAARLLILPCIGRTYEPGIEASTVTVLVGRQGIGKSLCPKFLFPEPWRLIWFSDEIDLTDTSKEMVEKSQGFVLVEISELAGAPRADLQRIKAIISRLQDVVRLAYRRNGAKFPRRHHFVGTGNITGNGLLPDDEEHRRWWPVHIPDDCDEERVMQWLSDNYLQLWAQGLHEYRERGLRAWLNPKGLKGEQHDAATSVKYTNPGAADLVDSIEGLPEEQKEGGMRLAEMLATIEAFGRHGTGERSEPLTTAEVAALLAGREQRTANAVRKELNERGWREGREPKARKGEDRRRRRLLFPPVKGTEGPGTEVPL